MSGPILRPYPWLVLAVLAGMLAACARTTAPAPVVQGHAGTKPAGSIAGAYSPSNAIPAQASQPAMAPPVSRPERVTVAPGETLYGVAHRFDLPPRAIIDANHLEPPYRLANGQVLALPQVRSHLVTPGETLDGVARLYNLDKEQLAQANHLEPPYTIKLGTVLVIPGMGQSPVVASAPVSSSQPALPQPPPASDSGISARAAAGPVIATPLAPPPAAANSSDAAPPSAPPQAASAPPENPPAPAASQTARDFDMPPPQDDAGAAPPEAAAPAPVSGPDAANSSPAPNPDASASAPDQTQTGAVVPQQQAPQQQAMAEAPPPHGGRNFLWPVRGRIIGTYGPGPNGTHNDGLNILAPAGTPVIAADSGVVAYAGNELRGYGNLILIKHDDGWMTAYAHNEKLLVKRGQRVTRGEVIAHVGATGAVSEPQLHFEVRKGTQALDPSNYLMPMPQSTAGE